MVTTETHTNRRTARKYWCGSEQSVVMPRETGKMTGICSQKETCSAETLELVNVQTDILEA